MDFLRVTTLRNPVRDIASAIDDYANFVATYQKVRPAQHLKMEGYNINIIASNFNATIHVYTATKRYGSIGIINSYNTITPHKLRPDAKTQHIIPILYLPENSCYELIVSSTFTTPELNIKPHFYTSGTKRIIQEYQFFKAPEKQQMKKIIRGCRESQQSRYIEFQQRQQNMLTRLAQHRADTLQRISDIMCEHERYVQNALKDLNETQVHENDILLEQLEKQLQVQDCALAPLMRDHHNDELIPESNRECVV